MGWQLKGKKLKRHTGRSATILEAEDCRNHVNFLALTAEIQQVATIIILDIPKSTVLTFSQFARPAMLSVDGLGVNLGQLQSLEKKEEIECLEIDMEPEGLSLQITNLHSFCLVRENLDPCSERSFLMSTVEG